MSTVVWMKDPKVLMNKDYIGEIWPKTSMNPEERLNAVSRLIIVITLLGYLITSNIKITIVGIIATAVFIFIYSAQKKKDNSMSISNKYSLKNKEAFTNPSTYKKHKRNFTKPTENNPLMNVLLPEIKNDPKRKPAAPAFNPVVEEEINSSTKKFVGSTLGGNDVEKKLFTSLGDNFEFEVGAMNRFYANPSTTIPNDQAGFADFCYGSMVSCKEGNDLACARNAPRIGSVMN